MKVLKNLTIGQRVNTLTGPAIVYAISDFGTRRGDIRPEIKNSEVELPTLKGLHQEGGFIGYVRIVPKTVTFLYGGEASENFILDDCKI